MAKLPSLRSSTKISTTGLKWKLEDVLVSGYDTTGAAGQSLKRLGMSAAGVRQLSSGQPILSKSDREIVARIVVEALS